MNVGTAFYPPTMQLLSSQTGGDTNDSAVGSGSDFDHNLTLTLPAGFLTKNRVIRVAAHLQFSTGTSAPTMITKLKLGSTTLSAHPSAVLSNSLSNRSIGIGWFFQASDVPGASVPIEATPISSTANYNTSGGQSNIAQPINVATNVSQVIKIATQWTSAGTGTNTITLRQFIVEAMG